MTPKQLRAELDSAVPGVVRQGVLPCKAQLQDANASHALSVIRVRQLPSSCCMAQLQWQAHSCRT